MKTSTRTHEGRVALVTGAAQGQAIALGSRERGAQVLATDQNLAGSHTQVPQALSALLRLAGNHKLKLEIAKYPLSEAAKVHQLLQARKTSKVTVEGVDETG